MKIWFDGGSLGNPGRGYGSYRIDGPGFRHEALKEVFGDELTNNEAEYLALLQALLWLKRNRNGCTDRRLEIFTDSTLVQNHILGRWKCRKPHLKQLKAEALELLKDYDWFDIKWHGRENNVELFGH